MNCPGSAPGEDGLPSLLEDWLTIWHSELAAMVVDRELQEARLRLLDAWAVQSLVLVRAAAAPDLQDAGGHDGGGAAPAGFAGAHEAAGAAAVVAAPDGRDAELERLRARVGELERQLAGG